MHARHRARRQGRFTDALCARLAKHTTLHVVFAFQVRFHRRITAMTPEIEMATRSSPSAMIVFFLMRPTVYRRPARRVPNGRAGAPCRAR